MDGSHSRVAFTSEDQKGRKIFSEYFRELGLRPRQDAAGNLIIRMEGKQKDLPAIIVGSHMDTVLDGGKYDGVYGCVGGLEVMEVLRENGISLRHPLEVIVFADEEGIRFGSGMFGSSAFCGETCGEINSDEQDIFGMTREDVMNSVGVDLKKLAKASRDPDSVLCTLELHVEQGGCLEQAKIPIGVVTSIAGVKRYAVSLTGEANHSGSTRMCDRRDALVAAAKAIAKLPDIIRQYGDAFTVGTVGQICAAGSCEYHSREL